MNLVKNKSLHAHLRDDEALVVENAVRLAIDSVINVLYGINSGRTREYQRMVADRDKQIQRLQTRLTEMEHELQVMRRHGCTCRLFGGSQSSGDPQQTEFDQSCVDSERTAEQQDCEMSITFGLFARPSSHVSSQSHESALPSSPSRLAVDQTCTSSESSGVSDLAQNLLTSPNGGVVIKEEPCDVDAMLIKWELSEEGLTEGPESTNSLCQEGESFSVKKNLDNGERRQLMEKAHPDPGGNSVTVGDHLRNKKKSVPMSQLPEEVQRLKRAAWRAASKRYYARKVARQQGNPFRSASLPHITESSCLRPNSLVDRRRRALISELPAESQTQQREAWRAASKRYYARKMARHQTDPAEFLLQNVEPSAETVGADREGSSGGGIMCS